MEYLKIGKITTTHGIKGELKVDGDNPCFRKGFKPALYIDAKPMVEVHINNVRFQGNRLIVSFKEFLDINQVQKYVGCNILADKESLDPLDENEYYINDLIGLEVYNEKNERKGVVKDVVEYPQYFYLIIEVDGKEKMIPFLDEFVTEVSDKIIIKEIEGLL